MDERGGWVERSYLDKLEETEEELLQERCVNGRGPTGSSI